MSHPLKKEQHRNIKTKKKEHQFINRYMTVIRQHNKNLQSSFFRNESSRELYRGGRKNGCEKINNAGFLIVFLAFRSRLIYISVWTKFIKELESAQRRLSEKFFTVRFPGVCSKFTFRKFEFDRHFFTSTSQFFFNVRKKMLIVIRCI